MSVFTDEDLKRLKDLSDGKSLKDFGWFTFKKCDALLARLEAAEHFMFDPKTEMDVCGWCVAEENDDNTLTHQKDCQLNLAYETWRKATGKSQ